MKRKYLLSIFFILCFGSCKNNKIEHRDSKVSGFIVSNSISNKSVTCFEEDGEGYIWIGTENGLNRYNGYDYSQFFDNGNDSTGIANNNIFDIHKDRNNCLWIATEKGITRLKGNNWGIENFHINENYEKKVVQLCENSIGEIFANTLDAVYKFQVESNTFVPVLFFNNKYPLNKICIDESNNLWLISRESIICYNSKNLSKIVSFKNDRYANMSYAKYLDGKLWIQYIYKKGSFRIFDTLNKTELKVPEAIENHSTLSKAIVTDIVKYNKNQLLINTHKNGIFLYNFKANTVIHQSSSDFPVNIPSCAVQTLFMDSNKNLWMGTYTKGSFPIYKYKNQFNNNRYLTTLLEGKSIRAIQEDKKHRLLIATYSDELFIYDPKTNKTDVIDLKSFFKDDLYYQNKIYSIYIEDDNTIWFRTIGKIFHCTYKDNKLIVEKVIAIRYKINQMVADSKGFIYAFGANGIIYVIDKKSGTVKEIPLLPQIENNYSGQITTLSNGKILVACSYHPLKVIDPLNYEIETISLDSDINLDRFSPTSLYEDSRKQLWIGTYNEPMIKYDLTNGTVSKINIKNVVSTIEDSNGDMWFGTLLGLGNFNTKKNILHIYYDYDGIGGNQFTENNVCRLYNQSFAFGGTHGLTIFNPSEISMKRKIPLYFENIKINGDYPEIDDIERIISNLHSSSKIKLKYNQNVISIRYAALDYSEFPRVRYYYKLEGYDKYWVDAKNNRVANYSNLHPGNYIFKIKATSNDNNFVESENSIPITVTRAPLWSTVAITVYALILSYIIYFLHGLITKLRRNKTETRIAIREKEHEAFINKMNMSFFSNISHEFRTPLTMIAGPITSLCNNSEIKQNNKALLQIVQRNIKRMLRLVNQLMDLSKLEGDALKLKVKKQDVIDEIKSILELYSINAKEKGITLNTVGLEDSFFMMIDADKLQKILGNILSNALKFTSQNGSVNVLFDIIRQEEALNLFPVMQNNNTEAYILIRVRDSGPGIPEDKLEDIFLRYYQIDDEMNASYNWGTGIGLYYTKQLITLHHGAIKAQNGDNGGSLFTFVIPADDDAYSIEEIETTQNKNLPQTHYSKYNYPNINDNINSLNAQKETILVVDDDIEIASYLKTLLSPYYKVITKYNGKSAFDSLNDIMPDIIVSDVKMPQIDGFQFCKLLKESISYCHIPVILLTAKTTLSEKIEGLDIGANAYVTKPFDPEYLIALIKSQLLNKKLLFHILNKNTNTKQEAISNLSPKDKIFMDHLYDLMGKELSNTELNISNIAEKMNMSRTKFYYKVKGLTGEVPNSFFKSYRLNKAAELIIEGENNISEIAEITGFLSLSHFSVSFKKQFNCNPSKYKG